MAVVKYLEDVGGLRSVSCHVLQEYPSIKCSKFRTENRPRICNQLTAVTTAVTAILREVKEHYPNAQIIIYGPADEIREILTATLDTMKLTPRIINPEEEQFTPVANQLILTWRSEEEEKLSAANQVVNIMNLI